MATLTKPANPYEFRLRELRAAADEPASPLCEASTWVLLRFEELRDMGWVPELALDKAIQEYQLVSADDTAGA